eukprot:15007923-Alexandrium_andersonii.AAC.1
MSASEPCVASSASASAVAAQHCPRRLPRPRQQETGTRPRCNAAACVPAGLNTLHVAAKLGNTLPA